LILMGVILYTGCSLKYLPEKTPGISVLESAAILENEELYFTIENKLWTKEPEDLTDYFTTFYITIRNRTPDILEINSDDIILLDDEDNQYDIVPQDYIEQLLLPHELEFSQFTDSDNQAYLIDEWRKSKQNLITHSFHFGRILSGAMKSGYIFYPKLDLKSTKCKIIFKNNSIKFIRGNHDDKG